MKRSNLVLLLVVMALVPSLAFAASHKLAIGNAQQSVEANTVTVPLEITNQDGFIAADIPLRYSEGVTLKEVNFEGTRVDYFDFKHANIDEQENTVVIGLIAQLTPQRKELLASGEGPVAYLTFSIDDPDVAEVSLETVEMEEPRHKLMFIYNEMGEQGVVAQQNTFPEFDGVAFSLTSGSPELPAEFALSQNYPNPFNPSTNISFSLPAASHVQLAVFNVLGQQVNTLVDAQMDAGEHTIEWDGTSASGAQVSSGVYFYRLEAGNFKETRKMMMLK